MSNGQKKRRLTAYSGITGVLHDGRMGVHLFTEDCPSPNCYLLSIPDSEDDTIASKNQELIDNKIPVVISKKSNGLVHFKWNG